MVSVILGSSYPADQVLIIMLSLVLMQRHKLMAEAPDVGLFYAKELALLSINIR